jgi:hypothetical protein
MAPSTRAAISERSREVPETSAACSCSDAGGDPQAASRDTSSKEPRKNRERGTERVKHGDEDGRCVGFMRRSPQVLDLVFPGRFRGWILDSPKSLRQLPARPAAGDLGCEDRFDGRIPKGDFRKN